MNPDTQGKTNKINFKKKHSNISQPFTVQILYRLKNYITKIR